jgi:ATP-dependent exoDNAse (exonuclease V) alpha subunit
MSLLEKIKQQKAEKIALGIRPGSQQISEKDISLRGTGLTKREAEKNTRAYEREVSASLKKGDATEIIEKAERQLHEGIEATLEEMRREQANKNIKYDESQLRAIAGIAHNKVSVLIGAAGTGKTTVTNAVVEQLAKRVASVQASEVNFVYVKLGDENVRMLERDAISQGLMEKPQQDEMPGIAFAAYTGRASQQIKRAIPPAWHKNISTIHSLLGYAPEFEMRESIDPITGNIFEKEARVFRPTFNKSCKLPYAIYVLDEASMIPIPLFNELIDAIHETSRILLIGDIHQLPPVYGKSVLGYAMRKWPVFELTTIHRQAAGNAIIANAHHTLQGKPLENAKNFHLIGNSPKQPSPAGAGGLQTFFLNIIKQLSEYPVDKNDPNGPKRFDPYKDTIIVPQNKGPVGAVELNEHLVTMFNPEIKENGITLNKRINIHTGNNHVYFALRDKVMITKNINTIDPPITNGMIGIVESININGKYDMKRAQVDFGSDDDDELSEDALDLDLNNLDFALGKALGGDEEEKGKKDDETDDQRQASHVLTIKFENGQTYSCSTAGDYRAVVHGYAITCHKSQGGEYPNIIILCHSVNAVMLTQEWLYTAITRARNNVYIVCNQRGLDKALSRQVIKGYTLKDKIKSYIIETKSDDDMGFDTAKFPILWEPKELN